MNENKSSADKFSAELETAETYAQVWQTVKDTVEFSMHRAHAPWVLLQSIPLRAINTPK